jgi:hypothetical protein
LTKWSQNLRGKIVKSTQKTNLKQPRGKFYEAVCEKNTGREKNNKSRSPYEKNRRLWQKHGKMYFCYITPLLWKSKGANVDNLWKRRLKNRKVA